MLQELTGLMQKILTKLYQKIDMETTPVGGMYIRTRIS